MSDLPDPFRCLRILPESDLSDVGKAYLRYVQAIEAENERLQEWQREARKLLKLAVVPGIQYDEEHSWTERRDALLAQGESSE